MTATPAPAPGRWASRRVRRHYVTGLAASYLATLLAVLLPAEPGLLPLAPALVTLGFWAALNLATRNLANTPDLLGRADERERGLRDHAHRIAYWVLAVPFGAVLGALFGAAWATEARGRGPLSLTVPSLPEFAVVLWGVMLLYTSLPAALIAWTEPDPLEDA